MFYPLKIDKAIQASAALLRRQPHQCMEFIRLLKLLYIADREAVHDTGRPIIGSRLVAMHNGPLHSQIYNIIKGEDVLVEL